MCYSFATSLKAKLEKLTRHHCLSSYESNIPHRATFTLYNCLRFSKPLLSSRWTQSLSSHCHFTVNRVKFIQVKKLVHYLQFTHHLLSLQDTLCSIKYINLVAAGNSHPTQSVSYISAFPRSLNYSRTSSSSSSKTHTEMWCSCRSNKWISEESPVFSLLGLEVIFQDIRSSPKSENHLH